MSRDYEKKLRDKSKLEQIDIQELMKYGKNSYFENSQSEFEDSFGDAFVLEENYVAYLDDGNLLLRYLRKYVKGISPDIVEEKDFHDVTTSDLLINSNGAQFLSRRKLANIEVKLSEEEQILSEKIDGIVQRAEEKSKSIKVAEKQHIRNFFKRLFGRKEPQTAISAISSMTEQEIEEMLRSVQERPEKPISAYRVEGIQPLVRGEEPTREAPELQTGKKVGVKEPEL